MWALQLLTYLAIVVFVLGVARRAAKYASAPMHLRWEIYPVPHEVDRDYGGSYMEEPDWWTKPRESSLIGELKFMIPEMVFLVALWHHNRKVWYVSYPFHGGIYVSIGFIALLVVGAIVQALGTPVVAGADALVAGLYYLTLITGIVGMVSVTVGCLGLLSMRLGNEDMRRYSAPADYFNLIFILLIALSGLFSWLFIDPSFSALRSFVQGLLTFNPPATMPAALAVPVVLLTLFMMYMPFTHMTHFIGKWFTYHTVRWDDTPNIPGVADPAYDARLGTLLGKEVGWSAPHVGKGRTWLDVATKEVQQ